MNYAKVAFIPPERWQACEYVPHSAKTRRQMNQAKKYGAIYRLTGPKRDSTYPANRKQLADFMAGKIPDLKELFPRDEKKAGKGKTCSPCRPERMMVLAR